MPNLYITPTGTLWYVGLVPWMMPVSVNDPSWKKNCLGLTTNPSAPPMITQLMTAPPVWSPWVSISAMREPSGVVYQDRSFGSVLSVDLSLASGGVMSLTASRRAVLSSSRQAATLIPSIVPPVLKAAWHTGPRAASHAASWVTMAVFTLSSGAVRYKSCTAVSIWASVFSVLIS